MSDSSRFSKQDLEYMPTDLLQQKLSGVGFPIIDSPNKGASQVQIKGVHTVKPQQKQTSLVETMSNDDLISEIAKFQADIQSGQSLMQKLQKSGQKHGKKSKKEQHHQVEKMVHASHKHAHKLTKHSHRHQLVQRKMRHHKQKLSRHSKKHMHRRSKHHKMKVHKRHAAKVHHHKKVGPVSKHHHNEHKAHLLKHGVLEPKETTPITPPMNYKAGSPVVDIKHSVPDVRHARTHDLNKVAIQKLPIRQQVKPVNIPAFAPKSATIEKKQVPKAASPKAEMENYMAAKKAQNQVNAAPAAKPAMAQPKPVKAVAAPIVKKNAQPADIRKSESFMSKVQDIQKTLNKKHIAVKSPAKKAGFSLMKALGGKKKAAPSPVAVKVAKPVVVAPAPVPTAVPIAVVSIKGHLELTRDSIKAKEQKEKEVVKEEDMAYSTDAITDYGANLNNIHDKYQTRFTTDGKKGDGFGINDIEVSSLDDEETPQKKTVEIKAVVQKPTAPPAAPKAAAAVVAPKPVVKAVEQPMSTPGGKLVASLVEPATTTVEAGGLKIEVSSLEDLD